MPPSLNIRVSDDRSVLISTECEGPVELGRQREKDEAPFTSTPDPSGHTRIVIARVNENYVSRTAARVEPLDAETVRVTNLNKADRLVIHGDAPLPHGPSRDCRLPIVLKFGVRSVSIQAAMSHEILALAERPSAPGKSRMLSAFPSDMGKHIAIISWLQKTLDVFQSAAHTDEFFSHAEHAVREVAGMDVAHVILRDAEHGWRHHTQEGGGPVPSRTVLDRVASETRTFWAVPMILNARSLAEVSSVVAAPILDRDSQVVGVLYGERKTGNRAVSELEARLVELIAGAVAAGLARLHHEQAALAAQVRFEQFFTPELAKHLTGDPALLAGRDAEVTLLFADIRGYSAVSERLGPAESVEFLRDILGALTDCVRAEAGVVLKYIGDEMMAMWGAPAAQPDHADRAAQAAVAMMRCMPELDARWRERIGGPLRVGIGLNSGIAWVGEVGTRLKFEYGAQGHAVNLASRMQSATKYIRTPLLMTGATKARLAAEVATRRLTSVRVFNVAEPVELFELAADPPEHYQLLREGYEVALTAFEAGDVRTAVQQLARLLVDFPDDGPTLLLHARAIEAHLTSAKYDPVWELPGK